jgi:hypothetical protein
MMAFDRIGCRNGERGFAYIWVLLLVAFMGIGLSLGAEVYVTSAQRDKEKELLAIGHQFRYAIGRYYESQIGGFQAAGKHDYPNSLEDLLKDSRTPNVNRYLRKVFVDPMTGKAEWGLLRIGGKVVGVHSLSDKQPIKQGNFEADDMSFNSKEKYSEWVFTYPSDLLLRVENSTASPLTSSLAPSAISPVPTQPAVNQSVPKPINP